MRNMQRKIWCIFTLQLQQQSKIENKTESMFAICHPKGYLWVEMLKAFSVTADYASLTQSPNLSYLNSSECSIQSNSKLFKCCPDLWSAFSSSFFLTSLLTLPNASHCLGSNTPCWSVWCVPSQGIREKCYTYFYNLLFFIIKKLLSSVW